MLTKDPNKNEDENLAAQLSATPIQFVFPNLFRCLHRMGCCRNRVIDQIDIKKILPYQMSYQKHEMKID